MTDADGELRSLSEYIVSSHWATLDAIDSIALPTREIDCPLCGHTGHRTAYTIHMSECRFGGGRLERYGCPTCDLVFGPTKMLDLTPGQLNSEYRQLYRWYEEADSTASEVRAFHACHPRPDGLYLNWGCGAWSSTIDTLRAEGWDVWGYEPNVPPTSPFIAASPDGLSAQFDAIFSNNVLEHLPDPVRSFREMREHLTPSGHMTHVSPCYEIAYLDTRFHLVFPVGRSAEILAEKTGFRIVDRVRDGEYHAVTYERISY